MDPEHELPQVEYAGFWRRAAAYIIDTILVGVAVSILAGILGIPIYDEFYVNTLPSQGELVFSLFSTVLTWLYFALLESSDKQATLGKMLMKIYVSDEKGVRISFARATGRHFGKIISGIIIGIGYLMVFWTEKKQGLHDKMAKTLVLRQ